MSALTTTARRRHKAGHDYSASDVVIIAAGGFSGEFSQWALAVRCWELDPNRFGMRGYQLTHPSDNRVLMEIVGKKRTSPVGMGWMERTRPNHFRVTPVGRGHAARLADPNGCEFAYAGIETFICNPSYRRWMDNPGEPSELSDLGEFIEAGSIAGVTAAVKYALEWMGERQVNYLTRKSRGERRPVSLDIAHVSSLADFANAMSYRFPQLAPRKARRA